MKHRFLVAILLGLLPALSLIACAPNPADDVPAAQVGSNTDAGAVVQPTTESAVVTAPTIAPVDDVAFGTVVAGTYPLTGTVSFRASKVTATHYVVFESWQGTYESDGTLTGTALNFSVDLPSLVADDGNERLQTHLKSADFFDVATYPTANFASTSITPGVDSAAFANVPGATHTVMGVLDIHGVTKEVSFPITLTDTGTGTIGAKTSFAVNRQDFELVYPGVPDDLIRDEVVIEVDASFVVAG